MDPLLAFILIDAFSHSTIFNRIIVFFLIFISIKTWGTIWGKFNEIKFINARNQSFFKTFKKKHHLMESYLEKQRLSIFALGSPMEEIYGKAVKELFNVMRRKGYADEAIASAPINESGITLSKTEMTAVRVQTEGELSEQMLFIEDRMSKIATVTAIAPSVGLLGTVWGIMEAFMSMTDSGSALITSVAPGISGALLTTALGLFVAIPSAYFYNKLSDRVKRTIVKTETFTDTLLCEIADVYGDRNEVF